MASSSISRESVGLVVLILILLSTIPASVSSARDFPEAEFENTIYVGASVSLSGAYEFEGQQALCGMKAAIDWVNSNGGIDIAGEKWFIKLVYEDDESNPEKAKAIYEDLLNQGIKFFIAPYSESLSVDIARMMDRNNALMMLYGPSSDRLARHYQSTLQVSSTAYNKYFTMFTLLKDLGGESIIVVSDGSAYAANSQKAVIRAANNAGLNVTATIVYVQDGSVKEELDKLGGTYSMLVILGDSLSMFKKIVEEAYNSRASFELVAGDVIVSFPHFYLELGGSRAENILGISEWEERNLYTKEVAIQLKADWYGPESTEEWVEYYSKYCKTGIPGSVAASASAAILALANYIYWAGSLDPETVRQKASDVFMMTFYGPIKVDAKGFQISHLPLIIQWIEGKKAIVHPEKFADKDPVYPAPNWLERAVKPAEPQEQGEAEAAQAEEQVADAEQEGGIPLAGIAIVLLILVAVAGFLVTRRS